MEHSPSTNPRPNHGGGRNANKKELTTENRELYHHIKNEKKREATRERRFEKHHPLLRAKMREQGIVTTTLSFGLIGVNDWHDTKLEFRCRNNHVTVATAEDLRKKPSKYLCNRCGELAKTSRNQAARAAFMLKLDEQGIDLVYPLEDLATEVMVQDRYTLDMFSFYPHAVRRWARPHVTDRYIRYVRDDEGHLFAWIGNKPIVRDPFIASLLENNEVQEVGARSWKKMEAFIDTIIANGDKPVNVTYNPTHLEGREYYKWGSI